MATTLATRAGAAVRWSARAYTLPTSGLRLLPDYLIIGAQRAGTTSLHRYLLGHPAVGNLLHTKGVHYFDTNYGKGLAWYRSHFPTVWSRDWRWRRHGMRLVVGEASPYYLFHPHVPGRVASVLPEAKLICLLRDPVVRAWSHYQHECARGFEELSFEQAIEREPQRLAAETERLLAEPLYNSFEHQHHAYLARGVYVDQLKAWHAVVPPERLLVLASEELFRDPAATFARVLDFLGLPAFTPEVFAAHNARSYDRLDPRLRTRLAEHFAAPNRALAAYLGTDFGWSTS